MKPTQKGNAIVEFVLFLVLWMPLLWSLVHVHSVIKEKHKGLIKAQLGTFLQTSGLVERSTIERELAEPHPSGKIQMGRYRDLPSASFYELYATRVPVPSLFNSKTSQFEIVVEQARR